MSHSTGYAPPTNGTRPDIWRELRDPRGRSCWVFLAPDDDGVLHARFTGWSWNRKYRDFRIAAPPAGWWDRERWTDLSLWEVCCPATTQEKLAELVNLNDERVLTSYLRNPNYRHVLNGLGPNGWTPIFRAAVLGKNRSASALIEKGANPYKPCFYDAFTVTTAVGVALGRAISRQPDLPVFAALMKFANFADEDVRLAHALAQPFRRRVWNDAEIASAVEDIDRAMERRKLQPLKIGTRWW